MHRAPISRGSTQKFDRLLYTLSIITIVMTIPQAFSIWSNRAAGGVSVFTWGTYLVSACVWLVHGVRKRDPSIYFACIGWIIVDAAIVVGAIVFR